MGQFDTYDVSRTRGGYEIRKRRDLTGGVAAPVLIVSLLLGVGIFYLAARLAMMYPKTTMTFIAIGLVLAGLYYSYVTFVPCPGDDLRIGLACVTPVRVP